MLLCDIGNTSYHFLDKKDNYKKSVESFNPTSIKDDVYYICVNPHVKQTLAKLPNWIDLSQLIDFEKYYRSMGVDRIVACEALKNAVIVDAGSAITVDVVRDGVFEGGFIYPGTKAMKQCFKDISSALDYDFNYKLDTKKLAYNSQDALSYGYLKLLYTEVNSHKLPIVLTGGDAHLLRELFRDAQIDELLIFDGMKKLIQRKI